MAKDRRSRLGRLAARVALVVTAGVAGAVAFNAATRVDVLPSELMAAPPDSRRGQAWARTTEALALANDFLASPFNRSMPAGRLEAGPESFWLRTDQGDLSLCVWNSWAGDLAVWSGAVAQECIGGFRVGSRSGDDPQVDHSWLCARDGSLRPSHQIAKTLLHEAAHAVHRTGNFGVLVSLRNYAEIAWHQAAWAERSFEAAPQGVDHEFFHWLATTEGAPTFKWSEERAASRLEEHLREPDRTCRHGPADPWRLDW